MQLSPLAQLADELQLQTPAQVCDDGHIMLLLQSQRPEENVPEVTATHVRLDPQASPQPPQFNASAPRFLQAVALGAVLQQIDAAAVALQDFSKHFESAQSIFPSQSLSTPSLQLTSHVQGSAWQLGSAQSMSPSQSLSKPSKQEVSAA